MYLQNKYTRIYYNIIEKAKLRTLECYNEKHHIIPRSLGGSDNPNNIVELTAKEHFICHLLLTKMTLGKEKRSMAYAAWQMTNFSARNRYKPTSKSYEILRKNLSNSYKGIKKEKLHWLGKNHTDETRKKQSVVKSGQNNPMFGRKQSTETKQKISKAQKGITKPKFKCEHCNKIIGGQSNYKRYHGGNCTINKI